MVFKSKFAGPEVPGIVAKGGRKPGTLRSTANAREAIARFVDGNAERLQGYLDEIYAEQGAKAAFECMTSLLEYHVPKLSRTETTGKDQGPVEIVVSWDEGKKG